MMIQCPSCGVSGRIPNEAMGSLRAARCPRCRYRFELGPTLPRFAHDSVPDAESSRFLAEQDERFNPESSSYELQAISERVAESPTDEPAATNDGAGMGRVLGEAAHLDGGDPLNTSNNRPDRSEGSSAPLGPTPSLPSGGDPWYSRILEIWGVVFLVWAGLLVCRSLYVMVAGIGEANLLPTTVAVLLLVPGAAGLFLLVDLGRYLRWLQSSGASDAKHPSVPSARAIRSPRRGVRDPRSVTMRFLSSRTG